MSAVQETRWRCLAPTMPPAWREPLARALVVVDGSVGVDELVQRLGRPGAVLYSDVGPTRRAQIEAIFRAHDVQALFETPERWVDRVAALAPFGGAVVLFVLAGLSVTVFGDRPKHETPAPLTSVDPPPKPPAPPPPPPPPPPTATRATWQASDVVASVSAIAEGPLTALIGARIAPSRFRSKRDLLDARCEMQVSKADRNGFFDGELYLSCTTVPLYCDDARSYAESALAASRASHDVPLVDVLVKQGSNIVLAADREAKALGRLHNSAGQVPLPADGDVCVVQARFSRYRGQQGNHVAWSEIGVEAPAEASRR